MFGTSLHRFDCWGNCARGKEAAVRTSLKRMFPPLHEERGFVGNSPSAGKRGARGCIDEDPLVIGAPSPDCLRSIQNNRVCVPNDNLEQVMR